MIESVFTYNLNYFRFMDKFSFPGIIGCIDGTHVALIRPRDHEETYFNRKNYHSLNVLIVSTYISNKNKNKNNLKYN